METSRIYIDPVPIHNASLGQVYTNTVNQSMEYIYEFNYSQEEVGERALRVYVESDEAEAGAPVLVVVRYEKGVMSWQLPFPVQDQDEETVVSYTASNRTLCPLNFYSDLIRSRNHMVTVSISTANVKAVKFSLSLYIQEDYYISMNSSYSISLTPSAPQFYYFQWPEELDTAIISVTSPQHFCMVISIQNVTCPVYDLDRNVKFEGSYQTIDTKTGISVRKDLYPAGFHLVFVEKATDKACKYFSGLNTLSGGNCHGPCRNKQVDFIISKKITKDQYLAATFGAFGMFLGAYMIVVMVSCILCVRRRRVPAQRSLNDSTSPVENYRAINQEPQPSTDPDSIESLSEDSSIDEDDIDMLTDADNDKEVFRTKTRLFVSDLARKSPKVLRKKSQLYQWNLLTIATFYALPVIQLVVTYQQVLNQTGNEDLCYYNFLCAHPLGLLSDFNHVFSNIGYMMLGGLFMVFVRRRDFMYEQLVSENPGIDRKYGIPNHSGLFYAMGFALIMEGLMSASYHICPNHSNFQFDTAFMYTIAILCMLKIYQFRYIHELERLVSSIHPLSLCRHPDINANAYTSFGVLAFVIFVGVMGVVTGKLAFWIFFTGIYIISCIFLSIQIYYMGRWRFDLCLPKRIWLMMVHDMRSCCSGAWRAVKPMYPDRMILLLIFNVTNWSMAAYGVGPV